MSCCQNWESSGLQWISLLLFQLKRFRETRNDILIKDALVITKSKIEPCQLPKFRRCKKLDYSGISSISDSEYNVIVPALETSFSEIPLFWALLIKIWLISREGWFSSLKACLLCSIASLIYKSTIVIWETTGVIPGAGTSVRRTGEITHTGVAVLTRNTKFW